MEDANLPVDGLSTTLDLDKQLRYGDKLPKINLCNLFLKPKGGKTQQTCFMHHAETACRD